MNTCLGFIIFYQKIIGLCINIKNGVPSILEVIFKAKATI
jgi:hypothetical protein